MERHEYIGLALVLVFAAVLRLGWPGVNSFGFDEARVSMMALQMAREGQVPAIGIPSSAGIPNPPVFVWLMAIPYALSQDPLFATQCVAAINVLAVVGVWALARRAWGPWAALTAGLLYCSAPYGVHYSRSIWSQDLMAPLAILWVWLGLHAVERQSGPALALNVALAGLAWQVHYSGAALIPVTLYLILRFRLWRPLRGPGWPWIPTGGALPIAAALPFGLALLRSGAATSFRDVLTRPATWRLDAFRIWAEVGAGHAWEWLPLGWDWRWTAAESAVQTGARLVTAALMVAGLVMVCWRLWLSRRGNHPPSPLEGLVLLWALASPVLFLRSSTPVYHQYVLTALPALALLGGRVACAPRRWQGPLVASLAVCVALAQGNAVAASIRANVTRLHPGGMGTPLLYPRAAAALLDDGTPIFSHARSDDPAYDADAAAASVLFWGRDLRLVNGESALLLPPEGKRAHLLFLFPDSPALMAARQFARVTSEMQLPRRDGEPPYTVLDVSGLDPANLAPLDALTLDNGLALTGWSAQRAEQALYIVTSWRSTESFVPGRYHQFNHLYAEGADLPLVVQDAALSSGAWAKGNTVLSWATFDVQASGPLYLETGMYTYPELVRVPLSPGQDTIRLGPIP
ncbi:MAG: glycosyltransferase family 39 protein [Anaerolineae bacterium]